jgi:hypothetical protein
MDDTITSNEVANDNLLGSLVILKSQTIDLKEVNSSSNMCLCLLVLGWGFLCLHVVVWGFGYIQVPS